MVSAIHGYTSVKPSMMMSSYNDDNKTDSIANRVEDDSDALWTVGREEKKAYVYTSLVAWYVLYSTSYCTHILCMPKDPAKRSVAARCVCFILIMIAFVSIDIHVSRRLT